MVNIFDKAEDTNNLMLFTQQSIIIVLSALPIVLIDVIFQKFRDQLKTKMMKRNLINIVQIIINILYIYFIMKLFKKFSTHYQITLPGMLFPGVFFSLQYCMFTDIHENVKTLLKV